MERINKYLAMIFLVTGFIICASSGSTSATDSIGMIYQQPQNRFIVYGNFELPSLILYQEVEIMYFDRVIGVGYIQEAHPSYIVVKVIKFAVDVFLGDATSVRRIIAPHVETLKKTVNDETPYEYDPHRMTVYPYVSNPEAKVKKIPKEVSVYRDQETKQGESEEVWQSRRRTSRVAGAEGEKKEDLEKGKEPALKEKTEEEKEKKDDSKNSSRRRRRAETKD